MHSITLYTDASNDSGIKLKVGEIYFKSTGDVKIEIRPSFLEMHIKTEIEKIKKTYRLLNQNEILMRGDEYLDNSFNWNPCEESIGDLVSHHGNITGTRPRIARREIK